MGMSTYPTGDYSWGGGTGVVDYTTTDANQIITTTGDTLKWTSSYTYKTEMDVIIVTDKFSGALVLDHSGSAVIVKRADPVLFFLRGSDVGAVVRYVRKVEGKIMMKLEHRLLEDGEEVSPTGWEDITGWKIDKIKGAIEPPF